MMQQPWHTLENASACGRVQSTNYLAIAKTACMDGTHGSTTPCMRIALQL